VLPEAFKAILPSEKHDDVERWWCSLNKNIQEELVDFYCDGEDAVAKLVDASNVELVGQDRAAFEVDLLRDINAIEFPNQDYYENLIGKEVYLCARGPTFHICKAHKGLRLYLILGLLPLNFTCFIGNKNCLMASHLQGKGVGYWKIQKSNNL